MGARARWAPVGPALAALVPLSLYEYLRRREGYDPPWQAPAFHFAVVTAASLLAGVVAALIAMSGWRQRNLQVTFVGLAFMSLTLMFGLHGAATPGFLLGLSHLPSAAAQLSILLTALWLAWSTAPAPWRPVRALARRQRWLVPAWAAVLGVVWALCLRWPNGVDRLAVGPLGAGWALAGASLALLGVAAARYWQSYLYSRFPLQLAIVYASAWLAVAQYIMVSGPVWHLSWWLYHVLLLVAVAALAAGVLRQYARGPGLVDALVGLWALDPVQRLQAGMSDSVRALIVALEARDPYTAGHSLRVALAAVRVGEAMGLPGHMLRALSQGGLLHDIGKFQVPESILNKPGPLTPEERRIVERHPVAGFEMASRLGLLKEELEIVRFHHERWDGTGYPDGLAGEQIPLLARIVAVVDVYDALTTERAYRRAWTHEQARTYILQQAGRQFDPRCVQVWAELTRQGPMEVPGMTAQPHPLPAGR